MPGHGKVKIKSRDGGYMMAIIGDEDTATGFLLSGVGHSDAKKQKNFYIVTNKTTNGDIENAFRTFTSREDIAVLMITQNVADEIRYLLNAYDKLIPTILEIPKMSYQSLVHNHDMNDPLQGHAPETCLLFVSYRLIRPRLLFLHPRLLFPHPRLLFPHPRLLFPNIPYL